MAPRLPVAESSHEPIELVNSDGATENLDRLRGRPIAAFCGLGHPEAFQRTLLDLGADLRAFRAYPDHHCYSREDVADLTTWLGDLSASPPQHLSRRDSDERRGLEVITTQKDLVKVRLSSLGAVPLWALRIRLLVRQGQEILDRLLLTGVSPPSD